jgi:hypothetical protein
VLAGVVEARFPEQPGDEFRARIAANAAATRDALGLGRYDELHARGATFDLPAAVEYLRAEVDRVLTSP